MRDEADAWLASKAILREESTRRWARHAAYAAYAAAAIAAATIIREIAKSLG